MRVEYFNASAVESDADLHYCGYEDTTPDFCCGPNVRDCYLLHYVCRGEGEYTVRGKTYPLRAGDIFCIFPKEVVYYAARRCDPWSFYWFSFGGRRAMDYAARMGFSHASPVVRLSPGNRLPARMDALLELMENNADAQPFSLLSLLYALFAEVEKNRPDTGGKPARPKPAAVYVEKAVQFMTSNYHRPIRIAEISGRLGLDRTYFSKLFGQVMGLSPQNYLLRYRIEKSLQLLQETDLAVGEIGRGVGMEDNFYFSRAFKQVMGMSPSLYRRACRDGRQAAAQDAAAQAGQ